VFNAITQLLDQNVAPPDDLSPDAKPLVFFTTDELESAPSTPVMPRKSDRPIEPSAGDAPQEHTQELEQEQEQVLASTLIVPRDTREIPGYSKWTEGSFNKAPSFHESKATRWPFILAALLLGIAILGQLAFHFRTAIAVAAPFLRPPLKALSNRLGADIPLPRHVELISIESSDLQVDPRQSSLLALQATLRNRAAHEQAYPALQLSLTDTQDNVIVRRVFAPEEYLSAQNLSPLVFAANAEISVHLWIEAKGVTAAGYRLYAFYP
jgi:hypothetical protein